MICRTVRRNRGDLNQVKAQQLAYLETLLTAKY
jgi:hypothetical protein